MDPVEMRRRFAAAKVARLATVTVDGRPHIVPITFAMAGETVYFAVDHKPKKTVDLKRLHNIQANPAVSVLVDHYEDDWSRLWWVRADGRARILRSGSDFESAIAVLTERYEQYRADRPRGPAVAIAIERMAGWSAS